VRVCVPQLMKFQMETALQGVYLLWKKYVFAVFLMFSSNIYRDMSIYAMCVLWSMTGKKQWRAVFFPRRVPLCCLCRVCQLWSDVTKAGRVKLVIGGYIFLQFEKVVNVSKVSVDAMRRMNELARL